MECPTTVIRPQQWPELALNKREGADGGTGSEIRCEELVTSKHVFKERAADISKGAHKDDVIIVVEGVLGIAEFQVFGRVCFGWFM